MRINRYVSSCTELSRRMADEAIADGRVTINGKRASIGDRVEQEDTVTLDGKSLELPAQLRLYLFNKPIGYVCSKSGQGSKTIYELLPPEFKSLNSIGRLDKNSSGLLLLTDDGMYAQKMAHPSANKSKVYNIQLNKGLTPEHLQQIESGEVELDDGISKFKIQPDSNDSTKWIATLQEGRNRQIRRTFAALGYEVARLHRVSFGPYRLNNLKPGDFRPTEFL